MSRRQADVVVVGGGVAGATTARLVAEKGHQVVLLDRARFPREKPCGEGVMPTGVRLLQRMGLLEKLGPEDTHVIRGVRFVLDERTEVAGKFPDVGEGFDQGLGIRRRKLDHLLLEHAIQHPSVEVHEEAPVTDVRFPPRGPVEVDAAGTTYRARIVVGADGLHSIVRRKRGLEAPGGRRLRYGLRAHFDLDHPCPDMVSVLVTPIGELYTTPVGPAQLQVAMLLEKQEMSRFRGDLEAGFEHCVASLPLLRGARRATPVLACGPFDRRARCRVGDRTLLVGDAAGYLDPITGEGISLALQSAHWAAESLDDALRREDTTASSLLPYHRRLEHALRHYKLLTRALLLLSRWPRLASLVVRRLDRFPDLYSDLLAVNCGVRRLWDLDPLRVLQAMLPLGAPSPRRRDDPVE